MALAGCSSADPAFYTLREIPGAQQNGPALTIEVRKPGLAGYLDRSDIVLKNAGFVLSMNGQHRWGEPLGDMIGRVLTEDLAQRLPASTLYTQSGAISADPALRVELDVENFDPDAAGDVVLNASFALERGITHRPLTTRHISLRAAPAGPDAASLAACMSALLGQLSDQIAQDITASPALPAG